MTFFGRFVDLWSKLTGAQKAALAVAVILLGLLISVAVSVAPTPKYVPLYANLSEADAASVVQKLKEMKETYHIGGQSQVEVREERVDELRMKLAGEGLPSNGSIGFELFDKAQFGQSEFGERLNFIRALQGELERTIMQLESVRTARVHLVLPEKRLYAAEETPATASVALGLRSSTPSPKEVKAIIHLVASAVEGLDPAQITVVDTSGNLLSDLTDFADGNSDTRLQDQRAVETQIEVRLQSMLDRVLGPDKALIRASVKLNYDRKHVERETYMPLAVTNGEAAQGVLESERRSSESYDPKVVNSNKAGYLREDTTNQYKVSKVVEQEDSPPGQVEEVHIALFLDESIAPQQAAQLQSTIANAAGTTREFVSIQTMAFDTSVGKAIARSAEKAERDRRTAGITRMAIPIALILLFLGALVVIYRRSTYDAMTTQLLPMESGQPYPMLTAPGKAAEQYAVVSDANTDLALAQVDPRRVAEVIQNLLKEER